MERVYESRTIKRSLCWRERTWKLLVKDCEEIVGFILPQMKLFDGKTGLSNRSNFTMREGEADTGALTWASPSYNHFCICCTDPIDYSSHLEEFWNIPVFQNNSL